VIEGGVVKVLIGVLFIGAIAEDGCHFLADGFVA
jgi:hypothetical protein